MNNTFYILRHAETEIDKEKPVSRWNLNLKGQLQAEQLCKDKLLKKADIIVASEEPKAYETAMPLARLLDKQVDRYKALNELNRDKSGYLPAKTFNFGVKYAMKNPDKHKFDWERASHAVERFSDKLTELDMAYNKKKIVVVSHGIVINLYIAQLLGKLHLAFERLQKNGFCSYAIVRDGMVEKDIF